MSIGLAVMPFGIAFGLAASDAGLAVWQTSAYSLLVFTGSAQFAAVEIIGDGGSVAAAISAGLLLNLRSLAFGVVMAAAFPASRWKRAAWSQLMIDESTAVGSMPEDRDLRRFGYLVAGLTVFVTWNVTTVLGATVLPSGSDLVSTWGIDAAIPAIFLALLWPRLAQADQRRSALAGAALALVLVPLVPPGVPIVAAALGAVAGWWGQDRTEAQARPA